MHKTWQQAEEAESNKIVPSTEVVTALQQMATEQNAEKVKKMKAEAKLEMEKKKQRGTISSAKKP